MSEDPSPYFRPITKAEASVVELLLSTDPKHNEKYSSQLESAKVSTMQDGGMGSLLFDALHEFSSKRIFGREIAVGHFMDEDGVHVSISLNIDQFGDLFEVDFWKVNFMPLVSWPKSDEITLGKTG